MSKQDVKKYLYTIALKSAMLTEPVTVFFKFVIGRHEFFVKTFLTFSKNDYHHFSIIWL